MDVEGRGCQLIREWKGDLLGDLTCLQKGEVTKNLEKWRAAKLSEKLKTLAQPLQVMNVVWEGMKQDNYLLILQIIV